MACQFVSAIQSSDLESLVELSKASPTRSTIDNILEAYETVITRDPANADIYNATLAALQESHDISEVVYKLEENGRERREPFNGVFNRSLFVTIGDLLEEKADNKVVPANRYLIASLISGSAIKTKACFSSDQVSEMKEGLHFKNSEYTAHFQPPEYEIKAVGALIQVLSAAKRILELKWAYESELKEAVEKIGSVITSSEGRKIHEAAVVLAQNGFKEAWESQDIWALLG